MNSYIVRVALVAVIASTFLSCGGARQPAAEPHATELMPESIGSTGWARRPEVAVFAGDCLFEYINGAAEMYHKYDFVDLHAAEYEKGDAVVTADVYLFATADMAFGMYTMFRPDEPDTVMLGIEGFAFGTNWIYVKGPYLVNVYTYDDSETGPVRAIATAIESDLRGTTGKPATFGVFPADDRVAYSEKIYAEAFLSQDALTDVYAIDYARHDHRFTLFVSADPDFTKLEAWRETVDEVLDPDMGYQHLPYDGNRYLHTRDSYRGEIIAGPIGGKLVGMVGYGAEDMDILVTWLHALIEQP
jgi:hypothetical protein